MKRKELHVSNPKEDQKIKVLDGKRSLLGGGGSSAIPLWAVVVHGGAWKIPSHLHQRSKQGVETAAQTAGSVLAEGKSAIEAVVAGLKTMEDNDAFDAGFGSCLTKDGEVEMDAILVDGDTLNIGAIAGIKNVKNPIEVARLVLEKSEHTLFVGDGAFQFAKENGIEFVETSSLIGEEARKSFEDHKKYGSVISDFFEYDNDNHHSSSQENHDTVGIVVIDMNGSIASGTTTGGITAKAPGRVGDSPLIGCGAIADSKVGGVSTTGHGESITKVLLAKDILNRMETSIHDDSRSLVTQSLEMMKQKVNGYGGSIALRLVSNEEQGPTMSAAAQFDQDMTMTKLEWAAEFTTQNMPWAFMSAHSDQNGQVVKRMQSGGVP